MPAASWSQSRKLSRHQYGINSVFSQIPVYAGDSILGLNEAFQRDPRVDKVNLCIGIYFDAQGKIPLMRAVREAERELLELQGSRPYLPMAGLAEYRKTVQALIFGAENSAALGSTICTIQTPGGSGALRIGGEFLKRYFPQSKVWISDPSWGNHHAIFEAAGHPVHMYPYYDKETGGLCLDSMLASMRQVAPRDIVLLHACCHNPTGVDLQDSHWEEVADALRERGAIAFVDMAYQGFGKGLTQDSFGIQTLIRAGVPCLVASSLSKNFALYGERCGALSIACDTPAEAERVLGQLTGTVRSNYSNPPSHGASVVAHVLGTPKLRQIWIDELESMRTRIVSMRHAIHDSLRAHLPERGISRYLTQSGMFSYTGLQESEVDLLREDHGIYLERSGRMCMTGLNEGNVARVSQALSQVLHGQRT